jgi:GT2 family glycosyltransferase
MNYQANKHFMELSVIIVSFNVSELLKNCLLSVQRASENIDCEIFVVDNNSTDDSCDMVESEFPEIILIKNKINSGFSVANNQAIKLSKGRFILLLNPDTLIEHDTFVKCITFINGHPDAGAMGVRMVSGDGRFLPESKRAFPTPLTAFYKSFGLSFLFPESRLFNRYYLSHIDQFETSLTEVIAGAFMLIRSEALGMAGLLDEDFFMYGEDIDLSYRLLQTGYKNYYFPETQIIHFKGSSTNRESFTDILHFYKAMRIYVSKRSGDEKPKFGHLFMIAAIYFREGLAVINRSVKIICHRFLR